MKRGERNVESKQKKREKDINQAEEENKIQKKLERQGNMGEKKREQRYREIKHKRIRKDRYKTNQERERQRK